MNGVCYAYLSCMRRRLQVLVEVVHGAGASGIVSVKE